MTQSQNQPAPPVIPPKKFSWNTPEAILNIPKMTMTEVNGQRHYVLPNGETAISMTTLLGLMLDKTFLVKWKKRVGEKKAAQISKSAAEHGTNYHTLMENYLHNQLDLSTLNSDETDTFIRNQSMVNRIDNVMCVEQKLFSEKYKIAGTVDVCAEYDGVLSIIDHKTSARPKKKEWIYSYLLQKAGYAIMLEELTGIKIEQIVTLIAVREPYAPPQIFIEKAEPYRALLIPLIEAYHAQHQLSIQQPGQ